MCCMRKLDRYCSNLRVLEKAPEKDLSDTFIVSGVKDKFIIQFELSWKVMKEAMLQKGVIERSLSSPRPVLKHAVLEWLELDEDVWLDMLEKRNSSIHMYDEELACELVPLICGSYLAEFQKLERLMVSELC